MDECPGISTEISYNTLIFEHGNIETNTGL